MREVFSRRGVAAETKSGKLLAIYVPHPLQQKLWHPTFEMQVVVCLLDEQRFFCSPGFEGEKNGY